MRGRKSGIYALLPLDGSPLGSADAAALGLPPGVPIVAVDSHAPHAPNVEDIAGEAIAFAGEVAERAHAAIRLGLPGDAPLAALVRAALGRFGTEMPAELLGEWSLLRRAVDGTVTLMLSAARRDPLLYAVSGARLAVAPDLFALARVPWVGSELDETGLLFAWGRAGLRRLNGDRTMLSRVRQVLPGSSVTIRTDGTARADTACVFPEPVPWRGSFGEALADVDALLREIMRERIACSRRLASCLSGGLDSSLLAWLAVAEAGGAPPPAFVTSMAPSGSGLADEVIFAEAVAEHLGASVQPVCPAPEFDEYRPTDEMLAGANAPPLATRWGVKDAYQRAAQAAGATRLVYGSYGELTVSARLHVPSLLQRLRSVPGRLRARPDPAVPTGDFHVRLAPHRLAALPESIGAALAAPPPPPAAAGDPRLLGYQPGADKALFAGNELYAGALRTDCPYRDLRLLRLCAGMPLAMLREGVADRRLARALLAGRLPDAIRLRTAGMPEVPGHFQHLQRQARGARDRIATFRAAEVDDWLDLDWLDQALGRVAAHGPRGVVDAAEVQLTAIGAEFLTWFRTRA